MDRRYLIGALLGGVVILAGAGAVIAIAETSGPVFIPGDKPVTEEQIRAKLQTDGYADIRVAREGQYFEASGAKDGKAAKLRVDSRTGRLAGDDDDDDD
ncbi:MAG TPA: hypothetical protein VGM96_24455 [Reyranella sp.]|jgi:hypothetical protein